MRIKKGRITFLFYFFNFIFLYFIFLLQSSSIVSTSAPGWALLSAYSNSCSGLSFAQAALSLGQCFTQYSSGDGKTVTGYQMLSAKSFVSGSSTIYNLSTQSYSNVACTVAVGSPSVDYSGALGSCRGGRIRK